MKSKNDVEKFLNDLKAKIKVFGVVDSYREKNRNTYSELGICQSDISDIISKLEVEDYSNGPIKDSENGGEYWVFGKMVKESEVYIKVNYGKPGKSVICISFHFAEFKIKYKFKLP